MHFPCAQTPRSPHRIGGLWTVGLWMLLLAAGANLEAGASDARPYRYVVVARAQLLSDPAWKAVTEALLTKHSAVLVTYPTDVRESLLALSAHRPDYVAFLATPDEAKPAFVWTVHRMMRELDEDPWSDAIWGIVTGYTAEDALRMAQETEPLTIERGASGTGGGGSLGPFASGFASNEGKQYAFSLKVDGAVTEREEKPDCIKALVDGFNTLRPQCFMTSGHATPKDWTAGYTFKGGQFRCDKGQLFGLDTNGKRYDIQAPEPKIYLPAGNCLIGGIPEPDCMATAFMHTGGVRQMFGYTVVTWFGYGGWGIKDLFLGQPGRFTFSEAAWLNHQSLLHQLVTKHALFANLVMPTYNHNIMDRVLGYVTQRHGMQGDPKETLGLLWDRDVVAFYGDPAWEARMPSPQGGLPWSQTFTEDNGRIVFTIKTATSGEWPGRPVMARLPKRLRDIQVLEGAEFHPVVADDFILVPLSGKFEAGYTARVVFSGAPLEPDLGGLKDAEAVLQALPQGMAPALRYALGRACGHRNTLVSALKAAAETADEKERAMRLKALAFLIANMPLNDLRTVGGEILTDALDGTLEAQAKAPWKDALNDQRLLNDVLPYASLDETREPWRKDLQQRFAQRAWEKATPGEAACWLNRTIFKELSVEYHPTKRPKPNQSPSESMAAGYASCSGLSILLVDACRACGIPARIAGIPQWKVANANAQGQHGGNHMWVEVWDQGDWHCLGAIEDTPLDQTWFVAKIKEASDARIWANAIYAASWQRTNTSFPLVWHLASDDVAAQNVTDRYLKSAAEAPAEPAK